MGTKIINRIFIPLEAMKYPNDVFGVREKQRYVLAELRMWVDPWDNNYYFDWNFKIVSRKRIYRRSRLVVWNWEVL